MGIRARFGSLNGPLLKQVARPARKLRPTKAAAATVVEDFASEFPTEASLAAIARPTPAPAAAAARRTTPWIGSAVLVAVLLGAGAAYALWPAATPPTGAIRIESDPVGATVEIDGKPRGTTPLTLSLAAGHHAMTLTSGGRRRMLPVDIAANATIVHHVDLPAVPDVGVEPSQSLGTLQVTTAGPADVSLDGTARGTAPLVLSGLTAGQHHLVIKSSGSTYERTINVEPGRTISLVLGETSGTTPGWLRADTPVPFTIAENGEVVGTTESDRVMMAAGEHTLEFSSTALGYRSTERVRINAGKVTALSLHLPKAPIQINALPWAEVWIDGERIGETPLANVMQTIGPHEIVFRHPQLGERRMTTVVSLSTPAHATVDMRTR